MAILVSLSSTVWAEQALMAQMQRQVKSGTQGMRISVFKPMLDLKTTVKFFGTNSEYTDKLESAWGASIGYANLPVQELGWTMNLGMMQVKENAEDEPINVGRVDLNLGIAFNQYLNFKVGANAAKITKGSKEGEKLDPRVGFQANIGLQLNENIGFDFGYTQMNVGGQLDIPDQSGASIGKADAQISLSGLEAALTATF